MRSVLSTIFFIAVLGSVGCSNETEVADVLRASGTSTDGAAFDEESQSPYCIYSPSIQALQIGSGDGVNGPSFYVGTTGIVEPGPFSVDEDISGQELSASMTKAGATTALATADIVILDFGDGHSYVFPESSGACHIDITSFDEERVVGKVACTDLEHFENGMLDAQAPHGDAGFSFDCAVDTQ